MPVIRDTRCFFLHVPRCGGTSFELHFGYADRKLHGVVAAGRYRVTLHHLPPSELIRRGYLSRDELSAYHVFTTIRDPFERLVSDYCWQRKHDVHGIFSRLDFSGYLDFAEEIVSRRRYFDKIHFDHFRPMFEYCYLGDDLVVDDVLLIEDIGNEIRRLPLGRAAGRFPRCNSFFEKSIVARAGRHRDRVYDLYERDLELYESVSASRRLADPAGTVENPGASR